MKAVIQRVLSADVKVGGKTVGEIGQGYLILAGFGEGDNAEVCDRAVKKISALRIFSDENDKTNLSLADVGGEILCISQFTLYADCSHGNRPSFVKAMKPDEAEMLYEYLCRRFSEQFHVEKGIFGADMKVTLVNDGPFTLSLEF